MRATEFMLERWTPTTVANYFDNKTNLKFSSQDVKITKPFPGCILLTYKTVPDAARSFFRVSEYYDGKHYGGKSRSVSLVDFLNNWMDRAGNVDYFKFWDGFNITDHAFISWLKSAGTLSEAEQVMVDAVKKSSKGLDKFCVIAVGGNNPDTLRHEMFHAKYYLDKDFKTAVDQLIKTHATDSAFKKIKQILSKKLDYTDHVDEEVAAYLYTGTQLKMVFGVEARQLVKLFKDLDNQ